MMRNVLRRVLVAASLLVAISTTFLTISNSRCYAGGLVGWQSQQQQQPSGPDRQPSPGTPATVLVSPNEDYRIGPNDIIEVKVEDAPELSNTYRVSAAGTFPMAVVGRIQAVNQTADEIAKAITSRLIEEKYLKRPAVSVWVKQINSRSFFIQGAVRTPGVYQIEGKPSLLELITIAGGLAENSGSVVFIIRKLKNAAPASAELAAGPGAASPGKQPEDEPQLELKRANINGLFRGVFDQNMMLEPGDLVNIPRADVFYVAGEVRQPGSFQLKEGTTLRQAIALAQGTSMNAAGGEGVIYREDPTTGKRLEIKVDVNAVMKNKKEDVLLQANDIVMVPNSRTKSVGNALLKALGMGVVQRGVIP